MKRINIIVLIVSLHLSLLLVSCTQSGYTTSVSTTSTIKATDNPDLLEENNKLKSQNKELTSENGTLKGRIEYLEKNSEESKVSPFESNYTIDVLLQKIFTEKSKVDIFPGKLHSTSTKGIWDETYFIFSIDRMAINPKWNGPGSDEGKGYYINSDENSKEYKGRIGTVFLNQGYENTQEKMEAITSDPKYNSGQIFNFYMLGNEIVYIAQDPGP